MSTPTVSVIIPTYNRLHLVVKATESVLAQTYTNYEIIIVNDGSSDNTQEVLASFEDKIIPIHQENKGLPAARNAGIMKSRGKYIAFLDDDDLWLPNKLEKQIPVFEANPSIGLVFSDMFFFNEEGKSSESWFAGGIPPIPNSVNLFRGNYIPVPTVVVRRELLNKVGLFDESLTSCEDYDLWLRLIEICSFHYVNECLSLYRTGANRMSSNYERMLWNNIRVQEKAFNRNKEIREISLETLDECFYSSYLRLSYSYIHHGEREKALLLLDSYKKNRGITDVWQCIHMICQIRHPINKVSSGELSSPSGELSSPSDELLLQVFNFIQTAKERYRQLNQKVE